MTGSKIFEARVVPAVARLRRVEAFGGREPQLRSSLRFGCYVDVRADEALADRRRHGAPGPAHPQRHGVGSPSVRSALS